MRGKTKNHGTHKREKDDEHENINVWVPTIFMSYGYKLAPISSHFYLSIYYILSMIMHENFYCGIEWELQVVSPEFL